MRRPPICAKAKNEVEQADEPEGEHEVVLRAGSLQDAHGDRHTGGCRQELSRQAGAQPLRDQRHAGDAACHGQPLHEVGQAIAANQQLQMHDRKLRHGPLEQLAVNVRRVVGNGAVLHPVHDPAHVVRHRVVIVRRRDHRHQPNGRQGPPNPGDNGPRGSRNRAPGAPGRGLSALRAGLPAPLDREPGRASAAYGAPHHRHRTRPQHMEKTQDLGADGNRSAPHRPGDQSSLTPTPDPPGESQEQKHEAGSTEENQHGPPFAATAPYLSARVPTLQPLGRVPLL